MMSALPSFSTSMKTPRLQTLSLNMNTLMRNHLHHLQSTNHPTGLSPDQVITISPACTVTGYLRLPILSQLHRLTGPGHSTGHSTNNIRATASHDPPCLGRSSWNQSRGCWRELRTLRLTSRCPAVWGPHCSRVSSTGQQLSFNPSLGATGIMVAPAISLITAVLATANLTTVPCLHQCREHSVTWWREEIRGLTMGGEQPLVNWWEICWWANPGYLA